MVEAFFSEKARRPSSNPESFCLKAVLYFEKSNVRSGKNRYTIEVILKAISGVDLITSRDERLLSAQFPLSRCIAVVSNVVVLTIGLHLGSSNVFGEGCFGKLSPPPGVKAPASTSCAVSPRIPPALRPPPLSNQNRAKGARVVNPRFERRPNGHGRWYGKYTGIGPSTVFLQIVDNGRLVKEIQVGEFHGDGSPQDVFVEAVIPSNLSPRWSWRFEAR